MSLENKNQTQALDQSDLTAKSAAGGASNKFSEAAARARAAAKAAAAEREAQRDHVDKQHELKRRHVETELGDVIEQPRFGRADRIEPVRFRWVWPNRIPDDTVTLLTGPADCGKSFLAIDLAARISRPDSWPEEGGADCQHGEVLYVTTCHDGESVLPVRLEQAGADTSNLHVLSGMNLADPRDENRNHRDLSFPEDLPIVEEAMGRMEAMEMVVIDSLGQFCTDRGREAETIRRLSELAESWRVAILVLSRFSGRCDMAGRFQGLAERAYPTVRSAWGIVEEPGNPARKLFLPARTGYGPAPEGLAYRIVEGTVAWEPLGELAVGKAARELARVTNWLRDVLSLGARPSAEVQAEAQECGFSSSTLRTARENLKIHIRRHGGIAGRGHWYWSLTADEPLPAEAQKTGETAKNAESGRNGTSKPPAEEEEAEYAVMRVGEKRIYIPANAAAKRQAELARLHAHANGGKGSAEPKFEETVAVGVGGDGSEFENEAHLSAAAAENGAHLSGNPRKPR